MNTARIRSLHSRAPERTPRLDFKSRGLASWTESEPSRFLEWSPSEAVWSLVRLTGLCRGLERHRRRFVLLLPLFGVVLLLSWLLGGWRTQPRVESLRL